MKRTVAALAVFAVLPALALAQTTVEAPKTVEKTAVVAVTGTIEAIDHSKREVTVRVEGGGLRTFAVQPDVKRFGELKVGDKLSAKYHEALVIQLRKPGAPAPEVLRGGETARVPGKAVRPSGAMVQQQLATVEVQAVDTKAPSITVKTEDGRVLSFKVEDPKNLEGVKVGDKIDVSYTEAFIVTVE